MSLRLCYCVKLRDIHFFELWLNFVIEQGREREREREKKKKKKKKKNIDFNHMSRVSNLLLTVKAIFFQMMSK